MLILFVRSLWVIFDWILNNFSVDFFMSAFEVVLLDEVGEFMQHGLYLCLIVCHDRCWGFLQGFCLQDVGLDFVINCQPVYRVASQVVIVDVEVR